MKVCQICAVDFTLYHFILPLMKGMAAAGHEVVAACADGPWAEKVREEGFRVDPVPFSRNVDLASHVRAYRRLDDLFRRERFDVIHVHTPVAALIGRIAGRRAGVPRIVYTAHGFYFHDRMARMKRAFFLALEWIGGRYTDVLFTQSREDADLARRYRLCHGGVIEAIGNGVEPDRFMPAGEGEEKRAALCRELDVPEDAVVVMMVGRLVAEKGYLELFEAMRQVDAVLWVAGSRLPSDHAEAIDAAIDGLGRDQILSNRVRLLGHRTDLPDLLRAADIFVLPSHREGMPRSIIEAMMTGLPVVATDIRGSREEVVDGETGILVPVGDSDALAQALNRLVADRSLRARQGAAGRARALELFDESKVIARQLELLGLAPSGALGDAG